jgi:ubiquinone/menaquinone biosynthesis C-methylase UbiE
MRLTVRILAVVSVAVGLLALASAGPFAVDLRSTASQGWDLDLEKAMDAVGIAPGMIVGEAGAGDGYFTLPMARRVGATGQVYANDISRRALDSLAQKAKREGLANVHVVEGSIDDPRFPTRDLELVVIVHAFHDFGRPVEWLVNLKKYLKAGATVAIIDMDPEQGASSHFWPRDRILGYASKAGYERVRIIDDISKHLIIVLRAGPAPHLPPSLRLPHDHRTSTPDSHDP